MKTLLFFFFLSLTGWVWMAVEFIKLRRFKNKTKLHTAVAGGIITNYEKRRENWGRSIVNVYYPVISFQTSSHEYHVVSEYSYPEVRNIPSERPPVGSEVVLYYDPSDPVSMHIQQEEANTGLGHFRLGFYIIAFSAVLSIIAAFILK